MTSTQDDISSSGVLVLGLLAAIQTPDQARDLAIDWQQSTTYATADQKGPAMTSTQNTDTPDTFPLAERAATVTTAAQATDLAIDWQHWAGEQSLSYGELIDAQGVLEPLAERFGLTEEFRENAII